MKPRSNGAPKVKSRVPVISTPMDDTRKPFGEKTKDDVICRSKSAEGISSGNKNDDKKYKSSQKARIVKSPSAGTAIRYEGFSYWCTACASSATVRVVSRQCRLDQCSLAVTSPRVKIFSLFFFFF